MQRTLKYLLVVLTLIFSFNRSLQGQSNLETKVVLFSLDGIGIDQFNDKYMPKLWALMKESGGWGASVPVTPSQTFPSHVSIATGVYPERHGVISNSFYDRVTGKAVGSSAFVEFLDEEPLWVASTRSGIRTGVYHWPCATGAWRGVEPELFKIFDSKLSDQDNLLRCSDGLSQGLQLIMAYLSGTDSEGHQHGALSAEVISKLKFSDDILTDWILSTRSKYPNLKVIITSDHGMVSPTKRINLYQVLKDFDVNIFTFGGSASIYTDRKEQIEVILQKLQSIEGLRAWSQKEIPKEFMMKNNPKTGDIFIIADLPNWLSNSQNIYETISEINGRKGAHGYISSAALPSSRFKKKKDRDVAKLMTSFFVFIGKKVGNLGTFNSVDIAPTITEWLSIDWETPRDGKPIKHLKQP